MIWAGLTLGLLTSLHCVGMCGPLLLALPGHGLPRSQRWFNRLNYHLGRSLIYAFLGAFAGVIGQGIELFTWQKAVALTGGFLMLLFILLPRTVHGWRLPEPLRLPIQQLRGQVFQSLKKGHTFSWLGLGALNGLLPCGPLYIALAGALTMGTWEGGALFMLTFGVGTSSALLALHFIQDSSRLALAKRGTWLSWGTAIVAVLLILRGLELGIPYISPVHTIAMGTQGCH